MKKYIGGVVFLLAISIVSYGFADEIGKYTYIEGRVDVLHKRDKDVIPVVIDEKIYVGDAIRTKSYSKAEITFKDNSVLRLAPNTRVLIEEYTIDARNRREKASLKLFRGKIRTIVSRAKGRKNFIINTPNASGDIKGSDIFTFYQGGRTGVLVKQGSISTCNPLFPDEIVKVAKGDVLFIPSDQAPPPPRSYLDAEMKLHSKDTDPPRRKKVPSKKPLTAMEGWVVKTSGNVVVRSHTETEWHSPKTNETVNEGDEIQTKEGGNVEIRLENGNAITLKPNTIVAFKKLRRDPKTEEYENFLEAKFGKMKVVVEKLKGKSKFEVKTPTAVCGIRGTIMYLYILPNLTKAFWQGGPGTITSLISGMKKIAAAGQNASADLYGNVTDPNYTTDGERNNLDETWDTGGGTEGYSSPEDDPRLGSPDFGTGGTGGGGDPTGGGDPNGPFDDVPFDGTSGPGTSQNGSGTAINLNGSLTDGGFGEFDSSIDNKGWSFWSFQKDDGSPIHDATIASLAPFDSWSGKISLTLQGSYTNPYWWRRLWFGDLNGTGSDGTSFSGWLVGAMHSWGGAVAAIYVEPSGLAGAFMGYLTGSSAGGLFTGGGDINIIPMSQTGFLPEELPGAIITDEDITTDEDTRCTLKGSIFGSIGTLNGDFKKATKQIAGESWGIWEGVYVLRYDNPDNLSYWQGVAGGELYGGVDEPGSPYYSSLEGIDNFDGTLWLDIVGSRLSRDTFGTFLGTIVGLHGSDFEGMGAGIFEEENLTSSGKAFNTLYNYGAKVGDMTGLIGVTSPLWLGSPSRVASIGDFNYASAGEPFIWHSADKVLYSYDPYNKTYTTYDGGAFYGIAGGIGSNGQLTGRTVGFYINPPPAGGAGVFYGPLNGLYSSAINMYFLEGTVSGTQMTQNIGMLPHALYANIWQTNGTGFLHGEFANSGSIDAAIDLYVASIANGGMSWGIFGKSLTGKGQNPHLDSDWSAVMWGNAEGNACWIANVRNGIWGDGRLWGDIGGFWFSRNPVGRDSAGTIGVNSEARIIGNYIEGEEFTWQAVGAGDWVEVTDLLSENVFNTVNDFLVNIPITEVHSEILQGGGTFVGGGTLTADMDFSVYANANAANLWTALINGSYTEGTSNGWNLNFTNEAVNVALTGNSWSGGTWHATASGNYSGSTIVGEAAGSYQGDPSGGTFTGIGAGTLQD